MMLQKLPTLMSPFLAQVQVIHVANAAGGTVITPAPADPPAPPDMPGSNDAALAELRANVAKIQANAKVIASAAKAKAKADLEQARVSTAKIAADIDADNAKAGDDGDTTAHSGTAIGSVHHKKSSSNAEDVAVPVVAMFLVFAFLIVRTVMAPFSQRAAARRAGPLPVPGRAQGLTDDEQAILLKLQRTISQMERRIESLETILIDDTRTKEKHGTQH